MMLRYAIALVSVLLAATPAASQVNVTGTWVPSNWTLKVALTQDGDQVWGYSSGRDFWFRGRWDGGRLMLVATNFTEKRKDRCVARGVITLTGKTVTALDALWWQTDTNRTLKGRWVRQSPDAGEKVAYPYVAELTTCGMLRTYDLAFASGSDKLEGTDWPILAAVGEALKQNASMKIEIAGHTDNTGDAKANQSLSERRAAAVKQILVSKYGADGARIATRGWGPDQAIQDNTTAEGRALNRRVEIVLSR